MNAPLIEKPSATSLTIRRVFDVEIETLWRALTNPEAWMHWFGGGYATPTATSADLRPGGAWRIEMRGNETGAVSVLSGTFAEVDAPRRVVFTWMWEGAPERGESVVTYSLFASEQSGQTVLILNHERLPDAVVRDNHAIGWSASFEQLAAHLAREETAR